MESKKICAKCGAVLSVNSSFCYQCGGNQFTAYKETRRKKVCAKCGIEVDHDAAFCHNCGNNAFVFEAVSTPPNVKVCKNCGRQVDPSSAFCPVCGYGQVISGKPTKKKEKKKLKWWGIVLIILGVCVLGAIGNAIEKRAQQELAQQANSSSSIGNFSPFESPSAGTPSNEINPSEPAVITQPEYGETEPLPEPVPEEENDYPASQDQYYLYEPVIRAGQDSAFGNDFLRVIIPIVNVSNENKYLKNTSITVCDANGNLVKELTATAYPNIIGPGEMAFYYTESSNLTLSDSFPYSVTHIEKNMGSGEYVETANAAPVYYSITGDSAEISDDNDPLFSYTVVNDSSETAEKGSIVSAIILYDENDALLDVMLNSVNTALAPGESSSFERLYEIRRDYDASENQKYEIVAFKQYITNGQ